MDADTNTDSDYTPSEAEVEAAYAAFTRAEYERGGHDLEDMRTALVAAHTVTDMLLAARLAEVWDEGVQTALRHAIRNADGITLRLDQSNPYQSTTDGAAS